MTPTAGDVERVAQAMLSDLGNAWKLNVADPHRRVVTVHLSSADLMSMAEVAIAAASAQLLAQIREPSEELLAAAEKGFAESQRGNEDLGLGDVYRKDIRATIRALADRLTEAK